MGRITLAELEERKAAEAARIAAVKASGAALPGAGWQVVPVAPARGPVVACPQRVSVPDAAGGYREQDAAWLGRAVMRGADVFDRMAAQAARRGGVGLSPGLIGVGRRYRDLTVAVESGGLKLQSWDGATGGAGARDFMDVYADQCARLRALHRAIGAGLALRLRRVRPSRRGDAGAPRRDIRDRVLVDQVCLGDLSLTEVMRRHGWAPSGNSVTLVREALADALMRMEATPQHLGSGTRGVDS